MEPLDAANPRRRDGLQVRIYPLPGHIVPNEVEPSLRPEHPGRFHKVLLVLPPKRRIQHPRRSLDIGRLRPSNLAAELLEPVLAPLRLATRGLAPADSRHRAAGRLRHGGLPPGLGHLYARGLGLGLGRLATGYLATGHLITRYLGTDGLGIGHLGVCDGYRQHTGKGKKGAFHGY